MLPNIHNLRDSKFYMDFRGVDAAAELVPKLSTPSIVMFYLRRGSLLSSLSSCSCIAAATTPPATPKTVLLR